MVAEDSVYETNTSLVTFGYNRNAVIDGYSI